MLISLIIGTLNRAEYLSKCLDSIRRQTYSHYEVVIIDQSTNDETKELVEKIDSIRIVYKKVEFKGLAKARNEAIKLASGDLFCLIDDDAYYHKDYLLNLVKIYNKHNNIIVSGVLWNAITQTPFVNYSGLKEGESLSFWKLTRYCPSPAISFPRSLIDEVGLFDENFGVGAKYGAAEETDLLIRAKKTGYSVIHSKKIKAQHPHKWVKDNGTIDKEKIYSYSYGIGAMYKKNTGGRLLSVIGLVYLERLFRDVIKGLINSEDWNLYHNLKKGFDDYKVTE